MRPVTDRAFAAVVWARRDPRRGCHASVSRWVSRGDRGEEARREPRQRTLNHHWPKFIPRRFNVTYLPKVGITDPAKTWHSFRHVQTGLARQCVTRPSGRSLGPRSYERGRGVQT